MNNYTVHPIAKGKKIWRVTFVVLVMLTLHSCGKRKNSEVLASPDNLGYVLKQAVTSRIVVSVSGFLSASEALENRTESFCINLTEGDLVLLQEQWIDTNEAWFRLANYQFGPLNDDLVFPPFTFVDSLRLRGTQYLETVRAEINKDVTGTFALNEEYFDAKTFQRVGLLALEALVFETTGVPQSRDLMDVVTEFQQVPRKCEVLIHLASLLSRQALYFQSGWLTAYKSTAPSYQTLFVSDALEDGTPALTELLTSVQEQLDYLRARNVVNVAAPLAGSAWQAVGASIDEISLLLEGDGSQTINFFSIMRSAGYTTYVDEVRENIAFALSAISEKNRPNLELALSQLDGNFKRQIPEGLNVELGINFSDGD